MEREKDIEQYLKKRIDAMGGICWKFTSPGTAGVPDRIILYRRCVWFVELKKPGGRLSPVQETRLAQIRDQGFPVSVIDSKEGVQELEETLKLHAHYWTRVPYDLN